METFDSCLGTRSITRICCLPLGRSAEHSADPEEAVRGEWRAVIRQMSPTGTGAFMRRIRASSWSGRHVQQGSRALIPCICIERPMKQ